MSVVHITVYRLRYGCYRLRAEIPTARNEPRCQKTRTVRVANARELTARRDAFSAEMQTLLMTAGTIKPDTSNTGRPAASTESSSATA